jgi:hypothetical protein
MHNLFGLIAVWTAATITLAHASDVRNFYNQQGNFSGSARSGSDGRNDYYDKHGNFDGSSRRTSSGGTDYYDKRGNFKGSER